MFHRMQRRFAVAILDRDEEGGDDACDPDAPAPAHPRWFDLDAFEGEPRLTNWVARCDDLSGALLSAPEGAGRIMDFQRGDLHWQMAVPADGRLPFDGAFPALIAWQGGAKGPDHPVRRLPESGCRLRRLELIHPQADRLAAALAPLIADPRIVVLQGPVSGQVAVIDTPDGEGRL
ncbi:VOC family protein [Thioclava sp. BHET1]|nr:VOC family protein [Thioclava sp. BHET1]